MDREARKTEYLRSFTEAFSEHGIDKTSIKKLAAAAGINEASIYQYFVNKDEIILDCVKQYFQYLVEKLDPLIREESVSLEERLKEMVGVFLEAEGSTKFVIQVLANPIYGKLCEPAIQQFVERIQRAAELLSKQLHVPYERVLPILYLLCSVTVSDKIMNQSEVTTMQLRLLMSLFQRDAAY